MGERIPPADSYLLKLRAFRFCSGGYGLRGYRKGDRKTAAISPIVSCNNPMVEFHDALADGQTKTGTSAGFRTRCDLHEPLEDVLKPIGRHTRAFIPKLDHPLSVGTS